MTDGDGTVVRHVAPLGGPVAATVRPPGSKSVTNRALVVAALASGTSTLRGVLASDDTAAMVGCLGQLGAAIGPGPADDELVVTGVGGRPGAVPPGAVLDARLSGTTARFVLPVCALGAGPYTVDGGAPLRARPMAGAIDALVTLGARVVATDGGLPVTVAGGPVAGGAVTVDGSVSSQFLSGLAMAGACMPDGLALTVAGTLVSQPYVAMTTAVMAAFGARVDDADGVLAVAPTGYRATTFDVEADASAASYFLAAAAVCGGTVRVDGVGAAGTQGDVAFASVLADMGCAVDIADDSITVTGPPPGGLRPVVADLAALSDTAPTLAAVAVFASGPTEVTGVGFIRAKETDRIAAVVTELGRIGIDATATDDGFVVHPGTPRRATVRTYDDHRMAMAFAVVGLGGVGIDIADPGCVAKTYPGFFDDLESLRRQSAAQR